MVQEDLLKVERNRVQIGRKWKQSTRVLIHQNEAFTCAKHAEKEKENENQDVIATALRDSHLLEMIAGNDLHQHKDEYQKRANQVEEFAIAVVRGTTRDQLLVIMDTRGNGCLKQQKPKKFS